MSNEWIGDQIIVRLTSSEACGAEILATLKEKSDDGITLSDIGELGPGPTMFCPWDSVRNVRAQTPENPPFGEDEFGMLLPYGESKDEADVPERLQHPSARTLERVVPVAQKLTVGGSRLPSRRWNSTRMGLGCYVGRSPSKSLLCDMEETSAFPSRGSRSGTARDAPCRGRHKGPVPATGRRMVMRGYESCRTRGSWRSRLHV